ncbi:MAG: hypothetical protein ACI8O8_002692, partial [Oleiphilaceae bacterium]
TTKKNNLLVLVSAMFYLKFGLKGFSFEKRGFKV